MSELQKSSTSSCDQSRPKMANRFFLRYSVLGVAIVCFFLLLAIKNQPQRGFPKSGHKKNSFRHNKHNLDIGRQKGQRQPQGMDAYKDTKEEPDELLDDDYSSYFYGSSYSVSISSSFYGNNSKIRTSFSSSSDSYLNEEDAQFLEDLKKNFSLKRQQKIKRKKEQRIKKLGDVRKMDTPNAAKIRLRNGKVIDEEGNIIKDANGKKPEKKPVKLRKGRSVADFGPSQEVNFTQKVELRQQGRLSLIKSYCENQKPNLGQGAKISDYTKKHILVIPEYRLMYCFVPKAGCSNWKRIMMVLTGQSDSVDGLTSDEVHVNAKFEFFSSLPMARQQEVLETYYKFAFVRDPMERLLSVYKNKFGDKTYYRKNKSFHSFGKGIIQHFRPNATKHQKISGEGVTWAEFVKYLLSPQVRKKYESGTDVHRKDHWDVQSRICSPCDVGYDFIGHLETIDEDAIYLLRKWGVQEKVKYLPSETSRPTNSTDKTVFDRNFGMLSKDQRERLYRMFVDDYDAFGYDKPPFMS